MTGSKTATANSEAKAEDQKNRELLRKTDEGCKQSFSSLYRRFYTPITRFAYRYIQAPEMIEEVVNETMLIVWQKAGQFRGDAKVSTWIMGIAMRQCWKMLKKAQTRGVVAIEDCELPSYDENLEGLALQQTLDWALDQLSSDHRATLELAYYVGYTCEEISEVMACPLNTVKTRLFHGRQALKKLFGKSSIQLDYTQLASQHYE